MASTHSFLFDSILEFCLPCLTLVHAVKRRKMRMIRMICITLTVESRRLSIVFDSSHT